MTDSLALGAGPVTTAWSASLRCLLRLVRRCRLDVTSAAGPTGVTTVALIAGIHGPGRVHARVAVVTRGSPTHTARLVLRRRERRLVSRTHETAPIPAHALRYLRPVRRSHAVDGARMAWRCVLSGPIRSGFLLEALPTSALLTRRTDRATSGAAWTTGTAGLLHVGINVG